MFKVVEIYDPASVASQTLRERVVRAKCKKSREFVAISGGVELALLSYENWSDQLSGFVYEIFVLPLHRRQGVGSFLLSYSESLACSLGCINIRLKPYSLDIEIIQGDLVSWYLRRGYFHKSDDPGLMEKIIELPFGD